MYFLTHVNYLQLRHILQELVVYLYEGINVYVQVSRKLSIFAHSLV